jgi:hypothetical protein
VEDNSYCWIKGYKAYEVDLAKRETVSIRDLRGHAVFLSKTRALSVSPLVFPSIRGNKGLPCRRQLGDELAPTTFSTEGLNVATLGHDE